MGPVLAAMRAGEDRSRKSQNRQINKLRRGRRWLIGKLHSHPISSQLVVFLAWALICFVSFTSLAYANVTNPTILSLVAVALQVAIVVAQVFSYRLVPKSTLSREEQWKTSAEELVKGSKSLPLAKRALAWAREDLETWDAATQTLLHTVLIGALVNVSVNNEFIRSLFSLKLSAAWNVSYLGTISLLLVPVAFFARILFSLAPNHWIKSLNRSLGDEL